MNWAQVDFWEGGTAYEGNEKYGTGLFKNTHITGLTIEGV
jgi:hypothetical protein